MRIGIFDSGIGGFSILEQLVHFMPDVEFYYIADDLFSPYGDKDEHFIINRAIALTSKLVEKKVDLVVVACNTATTVAIKSLRKQFSLPFVGTEPFFNIINHADYPGDSARIGLITTVATSKSQRFYELKEKYDPTGKIRYRAMPNLASLVEQFPLLKGNNDSQKNEIWDQIREELSPLRFENLTHLILGCTHYPLISDFIEQFLGLKTISPAHYVANRTKILLSNLNYFEVTDQKSVKLFFEKTSLNTGATLLNLKEYLCKFKVT